MEGENMSFAGERDWGRVAWYAGPLVVGMAAITYGNFRYESDLTPLAFLLGPIALSAYRAVKKGPTDLSLGSDVRVSWESRATPSGRAQAFVVVYVSGVERCRTFSAPHVGRQLGSFGEWDGRELSTDRAIGGPELRIRVAGTTVGNATIGDHGEAMATISIPGRSQVTFPMARKSDDLMEVLERVLSATVDCDEDVVALCVALAASRQASWLRARSRA
jgi:hypothetical protein